jgi:nucleotide-binding universal stress UspA family protein
MNINKILVPIDCSEHSTLALQWGASLAQKYEAKLLLLHVLPKAVEEVPTSPSWPIVAPYLGSGRGDPPLALHPSAPPVAPYPSSGGVAEGMARHGSSSQSEVVLIDYVEKAETALNDLAHSQLTWLTDKSEACPPTLLRSVYTLFGTTVFHGGSTWKARLVSMIRWCRC